ncbi:MAG: tetratricopeptide repeat protein, partial [Candidatus Dormibacteraceae bacterium]
LLSEGQYKDAVRELGRAAQIDPGSAKYAMGLAEALHRWNHNTTLLSYLEAVRPRFGNLPQFQYLLGLAHYGLSHYSKAVEVFKKLLTMNPPRQDLIFYYLGNSYLVMMEFPEAEGCYQKAIEINPKDATYYDAYAELLRKEGPSHLDQAVAMLEKARGLDPKDTRAGLELGLSYEAQQQLPRAQSLLEDCVRLQPDLLPAHVALARIYFRQGKREQGEKEKSVIARLEAEQQKKQLQLGAEHRGSATRSTSQSSRPQ